MTINYTLTEDDYLYFQLYNASQSPRIKKRKVINWFVFALVSFLFAIYFYKTKQNGLAIYFGIVGVLWLLFYKAYFTWKYKKHYQKYIKANYANRFGQNVELSFNKDHIYSKEKVGEGKINNSEIEYVSETEPYFFVKMSSGASLIIPKKQVSIVELTSAFNKNRFTIINHFEWKL